MLLLTTFDADGLVLRALRAGAAGFLLKDTPAIEIVRAIEHVRAGDKRALVRRTSQRVDASPRHQPKPAR